MGALQQAIITSVRARLRGDEHRLKSPCLAVGWARGMQSLLGYAFDKRRDFLKIYLAMPSLLPRVGRCAFFVVFRTLMFNFPFVSHGTCAKSKPEATPSFNHIQLSISKVLPTILSCRS